MPTLCLTLAAVAIVAAAVSDVAEAGDHGRPSATAGEVVHSLAGDVLHAKGPCRPRGGGGKGGSRPHPGSAPGSFDWTGSVG